ncbi:hypothetical protein [Burkholderia anthina]|uniref:hypothetical protein n=1 Tax=Burkholderia anthina TaxID=179879 RepID=UPI001AA095B4|nr:hypothetical protein [Burkholderia anthina]QTD94878.1 hypothetical protein J4G50_33115 [Burkholderia anthina]
MTGSACMSPAVECGENAGVEHARASGPFRQTTCNWYEYIRTCFRTRRRIARPCANVTRWRGRFVARCARAPPCCTVDGFDYSTGPMSMTMHSAMQSIANCSVDLSAQFLIVRAIVVQFMQLTVKSGRIYE